MFALWLIVTALAVTAFVPRGYMVASGKTLTVTLCTGTGPQTVSVAIPIDTDKGHSAPANKSNDKPCQFAGHGASALAGADPLLLDVAIGFILARGFLPVWQPEVSRPAHFQPPPLGPPSRA